MESSRSSAQTDGSRLIRSLLVRSLLIGGCLLLTACAKGTEDWRRDLSSPDAYVRGMASIALSLSEPRGAGPALPVLLETIDRSEVGLQREAALGLVAIAPFHVDTLLANLTGDEFMTEDRRGCILNALVAAGDQAPPAIVRFLRGPGREQVGDLGEVLLLIGPASLPAISDLAASPDDLALQKFAIFLLARFGPQARASLPILRAALDSPDEQVREFARQAIRSVGAGA